MSGQLRLKLEHTANFSRDRFIVSAPNREAAHTLDTWPDALGGALALVGPAGAGKSHLADAWANRTDARVLTVSDLREEAFEAEVFSVAGGCALLDRADVAPHSEAFFHLLNWAARPGNALLLTGRSAPKTWPVDLADLRSRLNALPVIELAEPDDIILRGLLLKLFKERHIRPPPDLIAYLLRRMERSAPAAEALVEALDDAALAGRRAVSRALARELLKDKAGDADDDA